MNWSSIANLLTNPIMIPIIFGLVTALARGKKWTDEKQLERRALQQRERARAEALRTGKPLADPGTVDLSTREMAANSKAAGQARLEALRQQRIEQLRKLRESRAGSTQASQSSRQTAANRAAQRRTSASAPSQGARNQGRATRPQRGSSSRVPSSTPGVSQRSAAVQQELLRQQAIAEQQAAVIRQKQDAARKAAAANRSSGKLQINRELGAHVGTLHVEHADEPIVESYQTTSSARDASVIRKTLSTRSALRHAIVVSEIFAKPVALRDRHPEI